MAEAMTSPFVMQGARYAVPRALLRIEQQVQALELAVAENPGLAIDLAKTLVESICRAVLGESSIAFGRADDLPKLFKTTSTHLPFLPATVTHAADTRKSLAQTLNGLHITIQGMCELRNQCGIASQRSGACASRWSVQALVAAEAADTIVGFLHRVHRHDRTPLPSPRALYDDNSAFNESVDDAHGMIRIFEVVLRPSEVLFQMELESYRLYLAEFDAEAEDAEVAAAANGPTEVAP